VDTGSAETCAIFTGCCVVVANSGYFAGGMHTAPEADISDGLLDVITVREGMIARMEVFDTREEALEAVGLRE